MTPEKAIEELVKWAGCLRETLEPAYDEGLIWDFQKYADALIETANKAQMTMRALVAERDAALAEAARLREALTKISQSTGCVEACPCWQRLRIKARAALAKDQATREGGG